MTGQKNISKELKSIFQQVLGKSSLNLKRDTLASDIEEWDSFNHIQLIVNVESHFDIKFSIVDIERFRSFGDLFQLIEKKLSEKSKPA